AVRPARARTRSRGGGGALRHRRPADLRLPAGWRAADRHRRPAGSRPGGAHRRGAHRARIHRGRDHATGRTGRLRRATDQERRNTMTTDGAARKPLTGVKVIDLSHYGAGPIGSMVLGDLGAEVIKVEHPKGDSLRRAGVTFPQGWSTFFL